MLVAQQIHYIFIFFCSIDVFKGECVGRLQNCCIGIDECLARTAVSLAEKLQ